MKKKMFIGFRVIISVEIQENINFNRFFLLNKSHSMENEAEMHITIAATSSIHTFFLYAM